MAYEGSDDEELPASNPTVKMTATAKLKKQLADFLDVDESEGSDEEEMETILEEKVEGAEGQFRRGDVIYDLNDADAEEEVKEPAKKKLKTKKKPDKDMEVHMKIKSTLQALASKPSQATRQLEGAASDSDADEPDEDEDQMDLKWKDNLAQKASEAFYERQTGKGNLRKLVYGPDLDEKNADLEKEEEDSEGDEELGGLFKIASDKRRASHSAHSTKDHLDCSRFAVDKMQDWTKPSVLDSIRDCFVTGKWKEDEDAEELLAMDDLEEDLEGDFEDLETGQVGVSSKKKNDSGKEEMDSPEEVRKKLLEKKRKLKEQFNADYDGGESKKTYYDELKEELDQQAQLNKSEFDGMDDETRVQYEGYRPGMYVRMEVDDVPCELVMNFNPIYPFIVGALLAGEENIGFVQVCFGLIFSPSKCQFHVLCAFYRHA